MCFSWSSEIPRHLIRRYERIAKSLWAAQMSFCTLMIQNIQKIKYALLRSHFFNHVINGCGIHNFSNIRKNKKCKSHIFCFNCVTPQFLLKHTFLGSKRSFLLIKIQRSVYEILTWKSLHHIFDLVQFDTNHLVMKCINVKNCTYPPLLIKHITVWEIKAIYYFFAI